MSRSDALAEIRFCLPLRNVSPYFRNLVRNLVRMAREAR